MENKEMEMMVKHIYAVSVDTMEVLREVIEMIQDIQEVLEYRRDDNNTNWHYDDEVEI